MQQKRVDFYLIKSKAEDAKLELSCKLIEKAYLRGHQVFVFASNEAEALALDELLWTFKADSFIPHNLQGEGPLPPPAVQIGFGDAPRGYHDILINLADVICPFYDKFTRVLELVGESEVDKEKGRARYREYKNLGCHLHMHELS